MRHREIAADPRAGVDVANNNSSQADHCSASDPEVLSNHRPGTDPRAFTRRHMAVDDRSVTDEHAWPQLDGVRIGETARNIFEVGVHEIE